jgi:hypothetical protein
MLKTIVAGLMVVGVSAVAENRTEQSPLTMEQLMRELRIQGGNFNFTFDQLVFARVTTEVTDLSDPAKKEVKHFDTASANKTASLFFSASAMFVGDYPAKVDQRKMILKLSDCKETELGRIIYYWDKFHAAGSHAQYSPAVPAVPELDKPYILHWYFKEGDPYYAKATIEFSAKPFPQ